MRRALWLVSVLALAGCGPTSARSGGGSGGGSGSGGSGSGGDAIMFEDERAAAAAPAASEEVSRGESLLASGDAPGAEAAFRLAIAATPNDARAHLDLGLALEMQERLGDAEQEYRAAAEADPSFAEALNNLGVLLRDTERLEEAVDVLRRAVAARPGFASAHLNLALALEEAGQADAAMQSYERVVALAPREPTARIQLGLLQLAAGRRDEALITLRRAVAPAHGSRAMLSALGSGLRRAGDAQMAVRVLTDAIGAEESTAPAAVVAELALAQFAAGHRPEAEQTLRTLIAEQRDYANAHYLLANMLAAREAWRDAATEYQAYLRADPHGEQAGQAQGRLRYVRSQSR